MSAKPNPGKQKRMTRRGFLILLGTGLVGLYVGVRLATPPVRLALARGAAGFVSKAQTAAKIIESIHLVLRGHISGPSPQAGDAGQQRLTPRQCEVLELLHQGLSNKLIARQLSLSDNTVRRHVQGILEYFQVSSRAEAVFAAQRQCLVD